MGSANSNKQAVMSFMKELKRRNVIRVAIAYASEFLLTATAQNLRRMASYLGTGPPAALASAAI